MYPTYELIGVISYYPRKEIIEVLAGAAPRPGGGHVLNAILWLYSGMLVVGARRRRQGHRVFVDDLHPLLDRGYSGAGRLLSRRCRGSRVRPLVQDPRGSGVRRGRPGNHLWYRPQMGLVVDDVVRVRTVRCGLEQRLQHGRGWRGEVLGGGVFSVVEVIPGEVKHRGRLQLRRQNVLHGRGSRLRNC